MLQINKFSINNFYQPLVGTWKNDLGYLLGNKNL